MTDPVTTNPTADLRSDTITRPSAAMLAAIQQAELGDDVFGDDPTVNLLQEEVAALLGKEAALFVPSGTMANQLALRGHTRHGDEVVVHPESHIVRAESAAAAALAGVQFRVAGSSDGSISAAELLPLYQDGSNPHYAPTRLLALENTHNFAGGAVFTPAQLAETCQQAHALGMRTHLDGARLMNACVHLDVTPAQMTRPFDSVSLCFSKGLGAPIGSVLCGERDFIARCYRYRKMYGGGMRQVGGLAAAARHALQHHVKRLAEDHRHARLLAEALESLPHVTLPFGRPQSNIVFFDWHHPSETLTAWLDDLRAQGVWMLPMTATRGRAVTHLDVSAPALQHALARIAAA